MGEKWLTSGRAQIKAMQKRSSFAANAMARAVFNERPCKTAAVKTVQSSNKSKHRSGTLRGNYSAYADPIRRRAVVGQGREDTKETENYVIQPSQRRRIRDHRAMHSHHHPQYSKPKAREDIRQITPPTFQYDAGHYYERMEPRRHSEHVNCESIPNHSWSIEGPHSQALDSSSHFHMNQTQVLWPDQQHLSGIQCFQDHPCKQQEFQPFAAFRDQWSHEPGSVEQRRQWAEYSQTCRPLSDPQCFNYQGIYPPRITAPSPQLYDSVSQIGPFLPTDTSSQVLDSFPDLEDSFHEDENDEFFFEEALNTLPNEEETVSQFDNSVEYCIEPELPKDKPIPQFVSIQPSTGIARFQRNGATSLTLACTEKSDQSFHSQPRGLMLPPRARDYQQAKETRSHEHHMDQENEVVRAIPTWKENPTIRFFNEKVEVDAENRPLSRPGSPVFNDELNLLGKKSLWE